MLQELRVTMRALPCFLSPLNGATLKLAVVLSNMIGISYASHNAYGRGRRSQLQFTTEQWRLMVSQAELLAQ
jgi:hypothetical protein